MSRECRMWIQLILYHTRWWPLCKGGASHRHSLLSKKKENVKWYSTGLHIYAPWNHRLNFSCKLSSLRHRNEVTCTLCIAACTVPETWALYVHTKGLVFASRPRIVPDPHACANIKLKSKHLWYTYRQGYITYLLYIWPHLRGHL